MMAAPNGIKKVQQQIQPQIVPQKPKKMELKFSTKSTIADPAQQFKDKENGVCSMFLIDVVPKRKAYRYDVEIVVKVGKKQKSLSKGPDDGQKSLNRKLCYNILTFAHLKTYGFGMDDGGELLYDCKSVLYTSTPIQLESPVIELKSSDLSCDDIDPGYVDKIKSMADDIKKHCGNGDINISISANQACPELDISNIEQYKLKRVFEEDRSVRTFLEMAITQFSLNEKLYTPVGAGKLFELGQDNEEEVVPGIIIRSGVAKGVRIVDNLEDLKPALVMDMKMSPFYKPQPLIQTVLSIFRGKAPTEADWKRIRSFISNIRVYVRYNPQRTFPMSRLTEKPLNQLMGLYEGQKMRIDQLIECKHGLELQYAHFPGVVPDGVYPKGRAPEIFPLEELIILPDQRVPLEKMDKRLSDRLLKASTLSPNERFAKIIYHAERMGVFDGRNNAVLAAFGIRVNRNSNQVKLGIHECPRIQYANEHAVNVNPDNARWSQNPNQAQYYETTDIQNWLVFCEQKHATLMKNFIAKYIELAVNCGMKFLQGPNLITYNGEMGEKWSQKFEICLQNNVKMDFVLLIDEKDEKSHDLLKYFEAIYKILTQHITIERVEDVLKGKYETLKNIIAKSNCKNFGLNYVPLFEGVASKFALDKMKTLVIAYDVAHPPPVSSQERRYLRMKKLTVDALDPSVVGICANMAANPNAFIGDYFFQNSRREKVEVGQLSDSVSWVLKVLAESRGPAHALPRYLFILRDGLSEGQHLMAFDEELNAIRAGLREYDPKYRPKLVFVIGTKRHYKKFFALREGAAVPANLLPGTVVAEKFVRSDLPEFFMQSHYPIKGVGKPVEYTVICDEIGVSQDELQVFLNTLCYSHQIVNSAISLPEPVYQADELAKRGRNNYLTMKHLVPENIQKSSEGLVDYAALTRLLAYRYGNSKISRFTA